jgi:hypothetical protein
MAHGCGCHQSKALCEAGAKCSTSTGNMCVPLPYPSKQVVYFSPQFCDEVATLMIIHKEI